MQTRGGVLFDPIPILHRSLRWLEENTSLQNSQRSLKWTMTLPVLALILMTNGYAVVYSRFHGYQSSSTMFGVPVISVGDSPRGIIALGGDARGFLAIGGGAIGVIAIGGFAIGIVAVGGGPSQLSGFSYPCRMLRFAGLHCLALFFREFGKADYGHQVTLIQPSAAFPQHSPNTVGVGAGCLAPSFHRLALDQFGYDYGARYLLEDDPFLRWAVNNAWLLFCRINSRDDVNCNARTPISPNRPIQTVVVELQHLPQPQSSHPQVIIPRSSHRPLSTGWVVVRSINFQTSPHTVDIGTASIARRLIDRIDLGG